MDQKTGEKVVGRVHLAHRNLLGTNTHAADAEFLQRVCAEPEMKAEKVGLLSKSEGENGFTFPFPAYSITDKNGQKVPARTSHDVIAWPNGERVDIIQSAGAAPVPGGPSWQVIPPENWRPSNVYVNISSWPILDAGAGEVAKDRVCTTAWGWFCWMRAWADWEAECKENENWIIAEVNPSVYRVMLCVEGLSHVQGQSPDPWRDAGVMIDQTWEDRFKKMLDRVGEQGRRVHCTVYGGRNQTPSDSDRKRFHDRIVAAAEGRWKAIRSFEMMNEFKVNKWTPEEVRAAGRDLRSKVPAGTLIALSSPDMAHGGSGTTTNEEMAASFDELYGDRDAQGHPIPAGPNSDHGGANEITIHTMRDHGKWSDPFAFNVFYPNLPKINNEPPGPGTSAGGENTTEQDVMLDLTRTVNAGWAMYVGHSEWCPWNGHLPSEYNNGYREKKHPWELPHMPECAKVIKTVGGKTSEPVKPATRYQLMPNDTLKPGEQLIATGKTCQAKYDEADGNFVLYTDKGEAIWDTKTGGTKPGNVQMNPDGNLVVYDADGEGRWESKTSGHLGAMAQLNDDLNLVIYEDPTGPNAGKALWSSRDGLVQ